MFVEPAEVLARWAYSDIAGTRAAAYDAAPDIETLRSTGGGLLQGRQTVSTWCGLPWRWRWRLHRIRLAFLHRLDQSGSDTLLGADCLQLGDDTGCVAVEVDPVHTGLL
jgi:hypothetical protein